jgi:hypothetical protein
MWIGLNCSIDVVPCDLASKIAVNVLASPGLQIRSEDQLFALVHRAVQDMQDIDDRVGLWKKIRFVWGAIVSFPP